METSRKWASVSISDGAMSARITLHLRGSACAREDSCWLHTHTRIRTHNSPWDQLLTRHTSHFYFIQALSVSLSPPLFLPCLLPLARLPDFALSVLSAVFCLFPYILFLSFFYKFSLPSLFLSTGLHWEAVVVLVELCVFVLCQCFESHRSDGISGVSPQLCAIISFCPIQHISEPSAPSGNTSKNNSSLH